MKLKENAGCALTCLKVNEQTNGTKYSGVIIPASGRFSGVKKKDNQMSQRF